MPLSQLSNREPVYPKSSDAFPMIEKLQFNPALRRAFLQVRCLYWTFLLLLRVVNLAVIIIFFLGVWKDLGLPQLGCSLSVCPHS